MTTIYECYFAFKGREYTVNVDSREYPEGLLTFISGFWIDSELNLVLDNQGMYRDRQKYWIPPHKINHIKKMTFETDVAA